MMWQTEMDLRKSCNISCSTSYGSMTNETLIILFPSHVPARGIQLGSIRHKYSGHKVNHQLPKSSTEYEEISFYWISSPNEFVDTGRSQHQHQPRRPSSISLLAGFVHRLLLHDSADVDGTSQNQTKKCPRTSSLSPNPVQWIVN